MYTQLCSWDNLLDAYRKAARGKRGGTAVAAFEHKLEDNLCQLQQELTQKTYAPGQYVSFHIYEPKRRLISAAPFRDRVTHHALCNVIEPRFERGFIFDSYANRVGKGTHRALDRCQAFACRNRFCLQLDVEQFFPAIDHVLLKRTLARKIEDMDVLWLIDQIIDSGVGVHGAGLIPRAFPGDGPDDANRPRGLPIGNLSSQFWANCYLDPLDQFITRGLGCGAYLRYVDDLVLFSDSKTELTTWRAAIVSRLAQLRLTVHPGAHARPCAEGIPFLGFQVFARYRRLKRRKGVSFERALRAKLAAYAAGDIALDDATASVAGWINHTRYANTTGLRKSILSRHWIPKRSNNVYT